VEKLRGLVEEYKTSLRIDRQVLLSKYRMVNVAHKVVGIGSVGTQCYIALLIGSGSNDPIFLQFKEAGPSVLEQYLGPSIYANHGERVINGQRLMQAVSGT